MVISFRILRNIFFHQILSVTLLIFGMSNTANAKNLVYENNWAYLADTVMGGVSQGGAEFAAEHYGLKVKFLPKTMVALFKFELGLIQAR